MYQHFNNLLLSVFIPIFDQNILKDMPEKLEIVQMFFLDTVC